MGSGGEDRRVPAVQGAKTGDKGLSEEDEGKRWVSHVSCNRHFTPK